MRARVDSNDHVVPMDTDSLPEATPADDSCGSPSPKKEVELKDILKLQKQVSDDIELKLKTTLQQLQGLLYEISGSVQKNNFKSKRSGSSRSTCNSFCEFWENPKWANPTYSSQ